MHAAEDLVGDLPGVPHIVERRALGVDRLANHLPFQVVLRVVGLHAEVLDRLLEAEPQTPRDFPLRGRCEGAFELFQPGECRLGDAHLRGRARPLAAVIIDDVEPANEPWQREPLSEQRYEDHRKRNEQDQIACRKRRTAAHVFRNRQRSRQRHDAAHPRPAQNECPRPRQRTQLAFGGVPVRAPHQGGNGRPGEAHGDDGPGDRTGILRQRGRRKDREFREDRAQLQAEYDEQRAVEYEEHRVPHAAADQARLGRIHAAALAAQIHAARGGRQHAGAAEPIGGEIDEKRRDQGDRHRDHVVGEVVVIEKARDAPAEPAAADADRDSNRHHVRELPQCAAERERTK